jgi:ATP-dependent exoDNAse (exonuclease V) beta subunit
MQAFPSDAQREPGGHTRPVEQVWLSGVKQEHKKEARKNEKARGRERVHVFKVLCSITKARSFSDHKAGARQTKHPAEMSQVKESMRQKP